MKSSVFYKLGSPFLLEAATTEHPYYRNWICNYKLILLKGTLKKETDPENPIFFK